MTFSYKTNDSAKVTLTERSYTEGVTLVDVDVIFDEPTVPQMLTVMWNVDCVDMYSVWGPFPGFERVLGPSWSKKVTSSRLASGAPLHALISYGGQNRMTVALSDAATPTAIATGVREENAHVNCEVRFFTMPINSITEYHATIYIDRRDVAYHKALAAAEKYWVDECGYPEAYTPDAARRPMYSCWYSFHQEIDIPAILEQCRLAKAMGMDSVIVDDGWQTDNNSRGYAYCGDWEPVASKVPDMKVFVDQVHEIGMKFILWYSVPFVGRFSKAYERFADMLLGSTMSNKNWASLDPRFPEVREYLIDIYRRAAIDWGLDGVKLDFIDSFRLLPETPAFDERWDTRSLEEGVDRLLAGITEALKAVNPDILIEFRQSYYGPNIRKYGNMIRVRDCPNDSLMNHVYGTDLRLALGKTPIHSDMLMWHNDDSVESAAHQVICTLFCVPQISVHLDKIPEAHKKMLAFWLAYWNRNRDVLLDGEFSAENPESLYSLVRAEKDGHIIAVAHAKPIVTVKEFCKLDFVNASSETSLVVRTGHCGVRTYTVVDCMGNVVEQGSCELSAGLHEFNVPRCGMLQIQ